MTESKMIELGETMLERVDYICSKQGNIEQRQCDNEGAGTDSCRGLHAWARGENANPSSQARYKMRAMMISSQSHRGSTYAGTFYEKDVARAEHIVATCYEVCERGGHRRGPISSELLEDIGASLLFMPSFRGIMSREHEEDVECKRRAYDKKKFVELMFPHERDGYTFELMVCHELMTPLNTKFEPLPMQGPEYVEWQRVRFALRREHDRDEPPEHPFATIHDMPDEQLFEALPDKTKRFVNECPASKDIENPRAKFTRAMIYWSEWYEDAYSRMQAKSEANWQATQAYKKVEKQYEYEKDQLEKKHKAKLEEAKREIDAAKAKVQAERTEAEAKDPKWYASCRVVDELAKEVFEIFV